MQIFVSVSVLLLVRRTKLEHILHSEEAHPSDISAAEGGIMHINGRLNCHGQSPTVASCYTQVKYIQNSSVRLLVNP